MPSVILSYSGMRFFVDSGCANFAEVTLHSQLTLFCQSDIAFSIDFNFVKVILHSHISHITITLISVDLTMCMCLLNFDTAEGLCFASGCALVENANLPRWMREKILPRRKRYIVLSQ